MIEASFTQQYGIRLRNEPEMTWDEFCVHLSGLNGDTVLGSVVRIRSETDRERIKNFSKQEKQIYDDWRFRKRKAVSEKEGKRIEAEVEKMFALAFG